MTEMGIRPKIPELLTTTGEIGGIASINPETGSARIWLLALMFGKI
jgi:hypothetical protein